MQNALHGPDRGHATAVPNDGPMILSVVLLVFFAVGAFASLHGAHTADHAAPGGKERVRASYALAVLQALLASVYLLKALGRLTDGALYGLLLALVCVGPYAAWSALRARRAGSGRAGR